MKRREFLGISALGGISIFVANANDLNAEAVPVEVPIEEATVAELQSAMQSGKITSESITKWYLARIKAIDSKINSIIELDPDAIANARKSDRARLKKSVLGPLHGIPVLLKDNIDTADKMKTTAGSLALTDAPTPVKDASIVAQLRAAGAIILGKTNLSEWANFRSNPSISGWSGRGGQTRNPYVLDRNPCGSSSGSAAAVAGNLAAVAIGTETDGSIVCPSAICGIVGLKPTIGLVSRSGIIPIAISQDTAGPMTRSVADAAAVLTVISAIDPSDPAMQGKREMVDYTVFLKADGLRGARIGVVRDLWGKRSDVDAIADAALETIKKAGATLIDVKFSDAGKIGEAEFTVLLYEFKDGLQKYLRERGSRHKTMEDLIRFNNENRAREMPYFDQNIMEKAAKVGALTDKAYLDALETCRKYARIEGIDKVMDANRLDAIFAPANSPSWMIDTVNGDCFGEDVSSSTLPAVAGYPNITVPAGFVKELPVGISLFGRPFSEGTLIKLAYAFEQATKARRKPKFLVTYK
ncbi:MAG TPA: amidase [Pyrinomonadaceae bacterium]|nr:amidase [Pyrinomonadaceae bacterium]